MTTLTHPPGRRISKPPKNLHAGMLVCPARWDGGVGPWAAVVRAPWWQAGELRVDVRWVSGVVETLVVPARVHASVTVVIP